MCSKAGLNAGGPSIRKAEVVEIIKDCAEVVEIIKDFIIRHRFITWMRSKRKEMQEMFLFDSGESTLGFNKFMILLMLFIREQGPGCFFFSMIPFVVPHCCSIFQDLHAVRDGEFRVVTSGEKEADNCVFDIGISDGTKGLGVQCDVLVLARLRDRGTAIAGKVRNFGRWGATGNGTQRALVGEERRRVCDVQDAMIGTTARAGVVQDTMIRTIARAGFQDTMIGTTARGVALQNTLMRTGKGFAVSMLTALHTAFVSAVVEVKGIHHGRCGEIC